MKSNPILEKKICIKKDDEIIQDMTNANITCDSEVVYESLKGQNNYEMTFVRDITIDELLSDFYDYLDKYYDLVDMNPGKEFLIKSFIEK